MEWLQEQINSNQHNLGIICISYPVTGLQVQNARLFEQEGIPNFIDRVLDILDRYQGYEIILNPNGGFKAVVPYTTLIGPVFGFPVYYIFEKSEQLIKMPGAPIDFDLDVLGSLTPVIGIIKDDYMKIEDFCKRTGKLRPSE